MSSNRTDQWDAGLAEKLYGIRTAAAMHSGMRSVKPRELSQVLNTRPDPIDQRDFLYKPSLVDVPARAFNSECTDLKFRVKEQGAEGSCVGQALASLIEIQNLPRFRSGADVPARISARFLYSNAQLYDHHPDDSLEGSSLRGAIKGFYHNGACDEKLARYRVLDERFKVKNNMWHDARRVALGTYFRLEHILNHYHCALQESGSILCSAIIHNGWNQPAIDLDIKGQQAGRIKYPVITTKRNGRGYNKDACVLSGGHAFVIVGYDSTGFLVLNSWGKLWGRFPVSDLSDGDYVHPLGDVTLAGVAHWSYDDWAENVLDAWIVRLSAPTGHGTDFVGGRPRRTSSTTKRSGTARKRDVQGHYMHLRDGALVKEPPYENDCEYFSELAKDLRTKKENKHYKHIVFFAHGGLNTLDSASARAAAMIPTFKKNGVYPVFFFWRTGFGHMLGSVIEGILPQVEKRTQNYTEMKDATIERLAKPIGRAIWNDIKRNAEACFNKEYNEYCEKKQETQAVAGLSGNPRFLPLTAAGDSANAWDATEQLLDICTDTSAGYPNRPLKLHFAAHSAGVFLLGELFERLKSENRLDSAALGSVNLLGPCCSSSYFIRKVLPICEFLKRKQFTVFNLNSTQEGARDPAMEPYSKSFPYLVSNTFYDRKAERIVALNDYWAEDVQPLIKSQSLTTKVEYVVSGSSADNGALSKCSARYHGEFDNDSATMNYILRKIIGQASFEKISLELSGFTNEQLSRGDF